MIQKLMQRLAQEQQEIAISCARPIDNDKSIEYEAGRRIGVAQGHQRAIDSLVRFLTDSNDKDHDL